MLLLSCKRKKCPLLSKTHCDPTVPLAAGGCTRTAAPGVWLLPSYCCPWRLAAALVLLPLAAGCCPRTAASGCWRLPSYCCPWWLAAALVLLHLATGCCPRTAAPGGWRLPSYCCPWLPYRHTMSVGALKPEHNAPDTTNVCCITSFQPSGERNIVG
jgi:hypothetical protein